MRSLFKGFWNRNESSIDTLEHSEFNNPFKPLRDRLRDRSRFKQSQY